MFFDLNISGGSLEDNLTLAFEASRYGWNHINFSYNQNDFKQAYYNRGIAKLGLKKYESAISDFTKELELNPKYDRAYYEIAIAEARLEHYTSAVDNFTKAIELNPENAEYYAQRGALISRTDGDLEKAKQDLVRAITLDDKDPEKYLTRAIIFCKLKMYLPAIDDLNIVIKLDDKNMQAYDLRSYAISSLNSEQQKSVR